MVINHELRLHLTALLHDYICHMSDLPGVDLSDLLLTPPKLYSSITPTGPNVSCPSFCLSETGPEGPELEG
jgi:hypothetical protein